MHVRFYLAAALFAIAFSNANAAVKQCDKYTRHLDDINDCACGSDVLDRYPLDGDTELIPGPQFPLVAVCRYHETSGYFQGAFLFKGAMPVRGEIQISLSDAHGELIEFEIDPAVHPGLPAELRYLRLEQGRIRSQLRMPRVSEKSACWSAPARMTINMVSLEIDSGTDNEGAYLKRYKSVKVGKFSPCPG